MNLIDRIDELDACAWVVACNGAEHAIKCGEYTYLYMFNTRMRVHAWYVQEQDLFINNPPFHSNPNKGR